MPQRKRARGPAEVTVEALDDEGIGTATFEGLELKIPGAFPGERVAFRQTYRGQRRMGGELLEVLEPSAERIASPCAKARECLGCPLIELSPAAQQEARRARVQRALAAYPELAGLEVAEPLAAGQPLGYRSHAKLVLAHRGGRLRIGIYRRGSHEVVDLEGCPLHHPLINRIVEVAREELERRKIRIHDPRTGQGLLRYLLVRVSPASERALLTLVATRPEKKVLGELARWIRRRVPELVSIQLNVNASEGNTLLGEETERLLGEATLRDVVGETVLSISPASFFQVNHEQAGRIYALVRRWAALGPGDEALDLFCGIGGIALALARDAGKVTGIEVVEAAVENARENARRSGLENARFLAGDVLTLLADRRADFPPGQVVVLNPPRKGVAGEALEAVAALAPRMIVYVSCNPTSLARDLALLHGRGYRVEAVQPVDMFPQTGHVETVVRLTRS
ncbi:MAG: 23S rRNA (uracil(1939)-C(5))-methyltransferase RlmD [Deltaproteobacteria bacterium]|nr:23S rRNA (uracil(1939)-C(5))-methyltransferase RlmD [Deltaproteobacteria bacterium]